MVEGREIKRTETRSNALTLYYITNDVMTGPLGGQLHLFPLNLNFTLVSALTFLGNKINCFFWDFSP